MSENIRRRITPQEEQDLNEVEETFEPFVTNLQSEIDNPNISMDFDYDDDVMPELTLEDLQVEIDPDEGITDGELTDDDRIGGRRMKRTRRRNSKLKKKSGKRKTKRKKRIRKTRKIKRHLKRNRKTKKK